MLWWRWLGGFGVLLASVAFVDILSVFYPWRFGDPSWEFGAIDFSLASLPLFTMGLAAIVAAALGRGGRVLIRLVAVLLLLSAISILAAYAVFLTNVPIALRLSPEETMAGIQKAIARTTLFAVAFSTAYLVAAVAAFRSTRHI